MRDTLLVILDLDQTIISSEASLELSSEDRRELDKYFTSYGMMDEDNRKAEIYRVYQRPYLQEFFDFINDNSDKFKLAVWTAASRKYATSIINEYYYIKPDRKDLAFIFFDEHCDISETHLGGHKDLRLVWDIYHHANSGNTVIIDDNEIVYGPQPGNSIRAPAFFARDVSKSKNDDFLATLPQKLLTLYYSMNQ